MSDESKTPFEVTGCNNFGWKASCPKGLWAINGPDRDEVEREAWHYYRQYAADGEYVQKAERDTSFDDEQWSNLNNLYTEARQYETDA